MGRRQCSQVLACRAGKFVQDKVPGAQLAVMVVESVVPPAFKEWVGDMKAAILNLNNGCDYECSLSTDEQIEAVEK